MRLIDADELRKKFYNYTTESGIQVALDRYAISCIDNAPTVDAVERKRGRWIKISITDDGYAINYRCSCCKGDDVKYPWKYCPNCGAEMVVQE